MSKVTELVGGRLKIRTQTQASSLQLTSLITVHTAFLLCPPKLLLPAPLKPCVLQGALQDPDHS